MKMRCPVCDGKGKRKDVSGEKIITCGDCYGTGELTVDEKTHFDQITATPEKLAEFISKITCECWGCKRVYTASCPHYKNGLTDFCDKENALEWLKQEAEE